MVNDKSLIDHDLYKRKIKEAIKRYELEILMEINRKMKDIQIEKFHKYKDGWQDCDLIELKASLVKKVNSTFLVKSTERHMRDIIHAFNYLFFLYIRYKRGER
ncbi:MAG: hypothetical protein ACTSQJ_06020 [Promethearchaeota archaeon]